MMIIHICMFSHVFIRNKVAMHHQYLFIHIVNLITSILSCNYGMLVAFVLKCNEPLTKLLAALSLPLIVPLINFSIVATINDVLE